MNGDTTGIVEADDAAALVKDVEAVAGVVDCKGFAPISRLTCFNTRHLMSMSGNVRMTKKAVETLAAEMEPLPASIAALSAQVGKNGKTHDAASIRLPNGTTINLFGKDTIRGVLHFISYGLMTYVIAKLHGWVP